MKKGFQNILVPVYTPLNAEIAVQRAIELADDDTAFIHVSNILNPFLEATYRLFHPDKTAALKLEKWEQKYGAHKNITFTTGYERGSSIPAAITKKAAKENADMIVMACSTGWWLSPGKGYAAKIAANTGVPVFSAKKSRTHTTSVVVPIQQDVQENLLEKIAVLSKKSIVDVHLVAYKDLRKDEEETASLSVLHAYQWLKSYIKCPVEYSVVHGADKTKAVNNYLHQLQNDVVLL